MKHSECYAVRRKVGKKGSHTQWWVAPLGQAVYVILKFYIVVVFLFLVLILQVVNLSLWIFGMTKGLRKPREQINGSGIIWSQVCVSTDALGRIWHTSFQVNLLIYQKGRAQLKTQATMITFNTGLTSKGYFQPLT